MMLGPPSGHGHATAPTAAAIIRAADTEPCQPWPRHVLTQSAWSDMARALSGGPALDFVALWADASHVHALFQADTPLLVSVAVEAGLYAALSPAISGAALFERMVADLWGHQAASAVDVRPWLDHGTWPHLRPLSARPVPNPGPYTPDPPDLRRHPGHPVPAGPLGPSWATPATWRATVEAETVEGEIVRHLEARFGWAHRGVLGLMRGASPAAAARIAARIDGTATVAHATAFARAVEAALGTPAPPAAAALRTLLLSLEHAAIALHDLSATADAIDAPCPAAAHARERLLAACAGLSGHRLMMDAVVPGGVAFEPTAESLATLDDALAALPAANPTRALARWAGHRAKAASRAIEAARTHLARIPAGPAFVPLRRATNAVEGIAAADGPHGPVWHWVRLEADTVAASFAAAPGWLALPALERAAIGRPHAEIAPLLAAAGLTPAGMDL